MLSGTLSSDPDPKATDSNDYLFGDWSVWLEEAQGRKVAEKFFFDSMNALLGPVAERPAFLKDPKSPRMESALRLLGNLAFKPAWTGFVMRYVRDELLPHVPEEFAAGIIADNFSEQTCSRPLSALLADDKLAEAKSYLDSLQMTEDLATFYCGWSELMVNVVQVLIELPAEKRVVLGLGPDAADLSFGRRLLRGATENWLSGVCEELAPLQSRIEALPQPRQERVLEVIRLFPGVLVESATPEAKAFHAWLMKDKLTKVKDEMERGIAEFLKAAGDGSFESEDDLLSRLKGLLHSMGKEQHPRGREVMLAACKVSAVFGTPGTGGTVLEMMLEQLSDYRELQSRENAPWLTALVAAGLRQGLPPAESYSSSRGNRLSGAGEGLLRGADDSVEGKLDLCMSRLSPFIQPGEARLVILWLLDGLANNDRGNASAGGHAAGIRWVEAQRGKCLNEELRLEMEMALRFLKTRHEGAASRGLMEEAALPVEQQHYLALLRDGSLPA